MQATPNFRTRLLEAAFTEAEIEAGLHLAGLGMVVVAITLFLAMGAMAGKESSWPAEDTKLSFQSDSSTWEIKVQSVFGGPGNDRPYDLWPTGDGNYVITGSTPNPERDDFDLFVIKVDENGELVWAKTFGGPELEMGFGVRTLEDGTIAVVGWTFSFGAGQGDFYLLGLDPDGNLKYQKTFGGPGEERATSLTVTKDGGLAIIGESYGHGTEDSQFYVVKTDADGTLLWEQWYDGGPLNERGFAILEVEDGLLLVGSAMDTSSGSRATISNGFVVKTDHDGNPIWSRSYGGEHHDIFHHAARLANQLYLLTGYTRGFGAKGGSDLWLVTIDALGEIRESRLLGGDGADRNIIARKAPDGSLFLAGYSQSGAFGGWDAQIVKLDALGEPQWLHFFGGRHNDGAVAVYPIDSHNLVVAGFTESAGAGGNDILFLRLQEKE